MSKKLNEKQLDKANGAGIGTVTYKYSLEYKTFFDGKHHEEAKGGFTTEDSANAAMNSRIDVLKEENRQQIEFYNKTVTKESFWFDKQKGF